MVKAVTGVIDIVAHCVVELVKIRRRTTQKGAGNISRWGETCFDYQFLSKFVTSFIFTGIQRRKTELFYKSHSVSFMYRWFICDAMQGLRRAGHCLS